LDGGDRKICKVGGLTLIYVQERAGRPELVGRNHEMAISGEIGIKYVYTVLIRGSSINSDAKYITHAFEPPERIQLPEAFIELSRKDAETLCAVPETVGSLHVA
jgi:hypothetical protein